MLDTTKDRRVPVLFKETAQVLLSADGTEAAVGQSEHTGTVRTLPGEETRPAGRTGGSGSKSPAEQHAFLSKTLQVRRRNGKATGLHATTGIMRV